jgi:hypothetical protein
MSTPRKIRIRKVADYGAGTSGHDHNYGFVFSEEIEDWQKSRKLKANEYLKAKYHQKTKAA